MTFIVIVLLLSIGKLNLESWAWSFHMVEHPCKVQIKGCGEVGEIRLKMGRAKAA